jgi:hypothetical protein
MEHNTVSVWKSSLSFGLFLGIGLVLVSVAYYSTGNSFHSSAPWVGYGVMIAGVLIAQLQFRKQLGGYMTYAQALGIGILTMLFASVITGFFSYLLYAVIDPSLQDQLLLSIEEEIVRGGSIPEEQIDMAVRMASKFKDPAVMFFMNIVGGALIGLLISLLTSIFTQKKAEAEF